MRVKVSNWPVVRPDDDGIRPAGKPDECFYCHRKVGEHHGAQCVCVTKLVRYEVLFAVGGDKLGTFERYEPFFWDAYLCESHKNESSWCHSNVASEDGVMQWLDTPTAQHLKQQAIEADENDDCFCGVLTFCFLSVVEAGPFVEIREDDKEDA